MQKEDIGPKLKDIIGKLGSGLESIKEKYEQEKARDTFKCVKKFLKKDDADYDVEMEKAVKSLVHDALIFRFLKSGLLDAHSIIQGDGEFEGLNTVTIEIGDGELLSSVGFADYKEAQYCACRAVYLFRLAERDISYDILVNINQNVQKSAAPIIKEEFDKMHEERIEEARMEYLKWRL